MTNLITQTNSFSLTPSNLKEAMEYADLISKSSIIPKAYQGKSGDILIAVQMGSELGLKPIQALQNIAVISGKPAVYGDALLALVQNSPTFEGIKESFDEKTMTAHCTVKRKGQGEHTVSFSKKKAEQAGLWNRQGPWKQYPERMLQMRARGFALRDQFADALGGLITVEEARDIPTDVTPKSEVQSYSDRLDDVLLEQSKVEVAKSGEKNINLNELILTHNVPSETIDKWCAKFGIDKIEDLPEEKKQNCIDYIKKEYQQVVTLEELEE